MVSGEHTRSDVSVGAAYSNSMNKSQSWTAEQARSEVAETAPLWNWLAPHEVASAQTRSVVAVGAVSSYFRGGAQVVRAEHDLSLLRV